MIFKNKCIKKEIWEASTRCKEQAEIELKEERGQVQLQDVKKIFARFSDNEKKREELV